MLPAPCPCSRIMALASQKLGFFLCSLAHVLLLLAGLVHCDVKEALFKAMNGYRESSKLPSMKRNPKADCLVSQMAWEFDDQSTIISKFISGSTISPSNLTQLPSLPDYLLQCKIEPNNTKTGLILPLYIPSLVLNLVLDGCTGSQMTKYLSKPEFTSVGIGYYQQWAVIALGTDSPLGSFSSAVNLSDLGLTYFNFLSSLLVGLCLLSG